MYKVPIHVLEGIITSLEQSNSVLAASINDKNSVDVKRAISDNQKQINLIKHNFGFNENKG